VNFFVFTGSSTTPDASPSGTSIAFSQAVITRQTATAIITHFFIVVVDI
jgi:hypothetical protein